MVRFSWQKISQKSLTHIFLPRTHEEYKSTTVDVVMDHQGANILPRLAVGRSVGPGCYYLDNYLYERLYKPRTCVEQVEWSCFALSFVDMREKLKVWRNRLLVPVRYPLKDFHQLIFAVVQVKPTDRLRNEPMRNVCL